MKEILQQIVRTHSRYEKIYTSPIVAGIAVAIKQGRIEECIKELQSMIRDNEPLMLKTYGFEIINEIKNM